MQGNTMACLQNTALYAKRKKMKNLQRNTVWHFANKQKYFIPENEKKKQFWYLKILADFEA
jgi:hypothetical protein